jgi:hypothetical protein
MIDEATKQRILLGRKAVEAYREAHKELHGKGWYKGISGDHVPLLKKMSKELEALGFASQQELFASNKQLCYEEVRRCYRLAGNCDGCGGRERGCIQSCYEKRTEPNSHAPNLRTPVEYQWSDFYDWQHFEGHSPPGCGMHLEQIAEPSFDIYWGMPKGIDPKILERLRNLNGSRNSEA